MKHALYVLILVSLCVGLALGGNIKKAPKYRADEGTPTAVSKVGVNHAAPQKAAALTFVPVDTASNAFGFAEGTNKYIAHDPYSNATTLIHRGYSAYGASGQIWYDLSTDGGASWKRVSELNAGIPNNLRYPAGQISNATKSANVSDCFFFWAAPLLINGGFGGSVYGVDGPLGNGTPASWESDADTTLGTAYAIWAGDGSAWTNWATPYTPGTYYWRTNDYINFSAGLFPGAGNADFMYSYSFIEGASRGAADYLGFIAIFKGDLDTNYYNVGYSKSTDNGATWGAWTRPVAGYRNLPGLDGKYTLAYENGYNSDMVVDAAGHPHFFLWMTDTNAVSTMQGILEVFETGSGWDYKWITQSLNMNTILGYPDASLQQMQRQICAATDKDGNVLAVIWADAGTSAATDTLQDIWFASRSTAGNWSTPVNLTNSPAWGDCLVKAAPTLNTDGSDNYTMYIGEGYEVGNTAWPPNNGNPHVYFIAPYQFNQPTVGVNDKPARPFTYSIDQNYPNPFNPSSVINYSLATSGNVKLTVYNILGQEVATLVNGFQTAGSHSVEFNAKNLSSGVYLYTINAGSFSATKKMVLMK